MVKIRENRREGPKEFENLQDAATSSFPMGVEGVGWGGTIWVKCTTGLVQVQVRYVVRLSWPKLPKGPIQVCLGQIRLEEILKNGTKPPIWEVGRYAPKYTTPFLGTLKRLKNDVPKN
ncbi:Uncharacterized protein Fot_53879 [Forsythia ovata]|uniref:Uncharacterized protein n=1 Tax=Forsythia ovata TaxID=205694 RepID=A0ABD1PFJ7_9LAMI